MTTVCYHITSKASERERERERWRDTDGCSVLERTNVKLLVWLQEMRSITLWTICRTVRRCRSVPGTTVAIQTSSVCSPCSSLPTGEMESFARSLSLRLSLKRSSFQCAADNHTYSMCWQAINLSRYFVFQSFIHHPGSWIERRLLHNISN